jgi:hypothetical protein
MHRAVCNEQVVAFLPLTHAPIRYPTLSIRLGAHRNSLIQFHGHWQLYQRYVLLNMVELGLCL